jgi:hypothetical protein
MQQRTGSRTGLLVAVLVILGFVAGAGIGLVLGWVVWPVDYYDTDLVNLRGDYKEQYIVLVGSAYAQDGDLEKAENRLDQLQAPNIRQWIAQLADQYISEGRSESDIRAIVALAHGLEVDTPQMVAYLASPTPLPTDTPPPTSTPAPTNTPSPTLVPSNTPLPTNTPLPEPTNTVVPPTDTAQPTAVPVPTNTPKPPSPTNTPKPPAPTKTPKPPAPTAAPKPAAAKWTWTAQLMGPQQDGQGCDYGLLQIRVTVVDANGAQIGGVWVHDRYSGQYQVTGNVGSPDWGPGETKFEYGIGGGGSLCIASGQGGDCVTDYTRDMPCYNPPPFEDTWAAGYCGCCGGDAANNKDACRQIYDAHSAANKCVGWWGHYSWRVVFKRSW